METVAWKPHSWQGTLDPGSLDVATVSQHRRWKEHALGILAFLLDVQPYSYGYPFPASVWITLLSQGSWEDLHGEVCPSMHINGRVSPQGLGAVCCAVWRMSLMQPCTATSELSGECLNSLTLYFVGNACLKNNLNTLFFKTIYLQTLCTFREGEDRREERGSRRALDPNQTKQTSLALISLQLPLPHPVYINKYSKLTKGQNQKCNQESATPSDNNGTKHSCFPK